MNFITQSILFALAVLVILLLVYRALMKSVERAEQERKSEIARARIVRNMKPNWDKVSNYKDVQVKRSRYKHVESAPNYFDLMAQKQNKVKQ
jgi:hypothetical protein